MALFGFLKGKGNFFLLGLLAWVPKFSEYYVLYLFASLMLLGDLFSLRWFFMGIEKMKVIAVMNFTATIIYTSLALIFIREC